MNIAILTTWNSACGIAEYSAHLVGEWQRMGHNILLLVNNHSLADITLKNTKVAKVFGVHWWGEDPKFYTSKIREAMKNFEVSFGPIDVLNVQYQSSLYEPQGFNELMGMLSCPKVVTQHDSTFNPKHKYKADAIITHNINIDHTHFIPFPTIEVVPRIFSFGMGRNDYDFIFKACDEIGVDFDFHDGRKDGWWSEEKLFKHMECADAIVLWYNEVPLKGQSAALRTAISSCRPVIVNDVGWFNDAPSFVRKVSNKNDLQIAIAEATNLEYIRKNSYSNCAEEYTKIFKEVNNE